MTDPGRLDRTIVGIISGFLLPVIVSLIMYLFSSGDRTIIEYFNRLVSANILTHIISLCAFSNLILFLIYNRFDMFRATRGIIGITIFWALLVFAIKFLA